MSCDLGPVSSKTRPTYGPGSVTIVETTRATSLTAIGEVRPVPNGSRMVPLSAMERAATVVNNGLSKKTVGRTCTTGSPDQFSTCSDSQCSRWWCDSLMLSASIWDTVICERETSASKLPTARATVATVAVGPREDGARPMVEKTLWNETGGVGTSSG